MMTSHGTPEIAIEAMSRGAFDYLVKPFDLAQLGPLIRQALAAGTSQALPGGVGPVPANSVRRIVGSSAPMVEVYKLVGQVAASKVTVLIRGESGTGKDLVARAIHDHGPRAARPFVPVNCAAIPEPLLESELFGCEKGAFTGAAARRGGRFEQADGGTIFLDEIGDMSLATQAKILRVLEDRSFERLGGKETLRADARVLAATHHDLEALISSGRFRSDLYFRLDVVTIRLPPLRERKDDIPALVDAFLGCFAADLVQAPVRISSSALERLTAWQWPGNVRELRHCLEQAVLLRLRHGSVIQPEHLRLESSFAPVQAEDSGGPATVRELARHHLATTPGQAYRRMVEQAERELLSQAFTLTRGNLARAARLLGISRPTLREKATRLGLAHDRRQADPVSFHSFLPSSSDPTGKLLEPRC